MPTNTNTQRQSSLKDRVLLALDKISITSAAVPSMSITIKRGGAVIVRTLPNAWCMNDHVLVSIYNNWSVAESNGDYFGTPLVKLLEIERLVNEQTLVEIEDAPAKLLSEHPLTHKAPGVPESVPTDVFQHNVLRALNVMLTVMDEMSSRMDQVVGVSPETVVRWSNELRDMKELLGGGSK